MKKFVVSIGVLVFVGGGCTNGWQQPIINSTTVPREQTTSSPSTVEHPSVIYEERAANATRYLKDKNFVNLLKSVQPDFCKGETPGASDVIETDLTGDGKNELVINATSCASYSSGSDLDLVAQVNPNGTYSALKINGKVLADGAYANLGAVGSVLVHQAAVHNPEDAGCCPTGGVDVTYFKWNGTEFVTEKTVHEDTWLTPSQP